MSHSLQSGDSRKTNRRVFRIKVFLTSRGIARAIIFVAASLMAGIALGGESLVDRLRIRRKTTTHKQSTAIIVPCFQLIAVRRVIRHIVAPAAVFLETMIISIELTEDRIIGLSDAPLRNQPDGLVQGFYNVPGRRLPFGGGGKVNTMPRLTNTGLTPGRFVKRDQCLISIHKGKKLQLCRGFIKSSNESALAIPTPGRSSVTAI